MNSSSNSQNRLSVEGCPIPSGSQISAEHMETILRALRAQRYEFERFRRQALGLDDTSQEFWSVRVDRIEEAILALGYIP